MAGSKTPRPDSGRDCSLAVRHWGSCVLPGHTHLPQQHMPPPRSSRLSTLQQPASPIAMPPSSRRLRRHRVVRPTTCRSAANAKVEFKAYHGREEPPVYVDQMLAQRCGQRGGRTVRLTFWSFHRWTAGSRRANSTSLTRRLKRLEQRKPPPCSSAATKCWDPLSCDSTLRRESKRQVLAWASSRRPDRPPRRAVAPELARTGTVAMSAPGSAWTPVARCD